MKQIMSILIKIMIVLLIIQANFIPISNAGSYWEEIFSSGDEFLEEGKNGQTSINGSTGEKENVINESYLQEAVNGMYNIFFILGVALSVIVGAVLGIKFMWGSIEQQAKVKELLIPYIIGCIIVFSAFGIWKMVVNIGNDIFPGKTTTYTKEDDGKLYCDNCGDELINIEQRRAKCSQCGHSIKGI